MSCFYLRTGQSSIPSRTEGLTNPSIDSEYTWGSPLWDGWPYPQKPSFFFYDVIIGNHGTYRFLTALRSSPAHLQDSFTHSGDWRVPGECCLYDVEMKGVHFHCSQLLSLQEQVLYLWIAVLFSTKWCRNSSVALIALPRILTTFQKWPACQGPRIRAKWRHPKTDGPEEWSRMVIFSVVTILYLFWGWQGSSVFYWSENQSKLNLEAWSNFGWFHKDYSHTN